MLRGNHVVLLWIAVAFVGAVVARPCGEESPNRALDRDAALSAPHADFLVEIARIFGPAAEGRGDRGNGRERTGERDVADIDAALAPRGVPAARRKDLCERVASLRARVLQTRTGDAEALSDDDVPHELPAEFRSYLQGALAWRFQDHASARRAWEDVLALPPEDRRHRSVWAAYMIGRSWDDDQRAVPWLRRTRELAHDGFPDPLDLAGESIG